MRATEHAPRDPFNFLERRHGLAEIVQRGAVVFATTREREARQEAEDERKAARRWREKWLAAEARATADASAREDWVRERVALETKLRDAEQAADVAVRERSDLAEALRKARNEARSLDPAWRIIAETTSRRWRGAPEI